MVTTAPTRSTSLAPAPAVRDLVHPAALQVALQASLTGRSLTHQLAERPLPTAIAQASFRPGAELAGEWPDGPGTATQRPDEDCADVMAQGPDGAGADVAAEGLGGSGPSVAAAEGHGASEGAPTADGSPEHPGARRRIFGTARRRG